MNATGGNPALKHVVLVGAGHAHVQVLKQFGMKPVPGIKLTLITREVQTPYSGMLPGLIAGHYKFEDAHIDTGPLCRFAGAELFQNAAVGVDQAAGTVICEDLAPIPYDILSINTGSTPNTASIPGADDYAIPVKPIDRFLARFEAMRERVVAAGGASRIALVGGGAAGIELILALQYRLQNELKRTKSDPACLRFGLITADEHVLTGFPRRFIERFETLLEKRGIEVTTGAPVTSVEFGRLGLADGKRLEADETLWVTEAQAPKWLAESGLPVDEKGFLRVDETLRAIGTENIFGAGDVIAFAPRPLPKSGVYSVRARPVLSENIRRSLGGTKLTPYKPQGEALYLVSTGEPYAVGTRNGFVFAGKWVWLWKDWIDRRFMAQFKELSSREPTDSRQ